MNKLIHAGFYRFIRNKIFIGCTLFSVGYCVLLYILQFIRMKNMGMHYGFDPLLFSFLVMQGVVSAVFISLFTGTEFSDGTIRNKLIAGFSKRSIYLAYLITTIIAESLMIMAVYIIGTALGVIMFGAIEIPITQFIGIQLTGIFVGATYVAIFHLITMLSGNKANAAIICVLMAFGILFSSIALYNSLDEPEFIKGVKNTAYLSGSKRMIYQCILDLLPHGQVMQMINLCDVSYIRLIGCAILESIALSGIGAYLFGRKDIK